MASIAKKDLPAYVRKCWNAANAASKTNRDAEELRLKFYAGGEGQWRQEEVTKRTNENVPIVTINKCKPAVDQIEGDIRLNPPGPECHPVGDGADKGVADIYNGLIREAEYRSGAHTAYATAGKYVAASGYGILELETEWASNEASMYAFQQRLRISGVEDPSCVFFDPTARRANREDAGWAGKIRRFSKSLYMEQFGDTRKIVQPSALQRAKGWIADAMGGSKTMDDINLWTGNGEGPYYVCEFYMVELDKERLTMYDNGIAYWDSDEKPTKTKPRIGEEWTRIVPRRKIKKYLVDAFEVLDETDWYGDLIPLFPVLGPEIYIDGKLHRLSLIAGALDAQRALNYVASSAVEMAGSMPRAPWIGPKGTFDDPRWATSNTTRWSYLEYTPVWVTNEMGQQELAPPPTRNLYEMAIQWILALKQNFSDDIKAVTNIYDPSLGQQKGDQSGKAIEQLRSESNVGNYSYADNLHRAIEIMYQQMVKIFPQIMDEPMAATVVKADGQHEVAMLNQIFKPANPNDQKPKDFKENNLAIGQYSVRVTVGPDADTRNKAAIPMLIDFFKSNPAAAQAPGVAAAFLRVVGEGNPAIEHMADLLTPAGMSDDVTPQQLQAQIAQLGAQNKQLTQVAQQMAQEIKSKLPELEYKKWSDMLDAIIKLRVAEVNASKDLNDAQADRDASQLEDMMQMAHDTASDQAQREHEQSMAQQQAAQQSQQQQTQIAADQQQQEVGAEQ